MNFGGDMGKGPAATGAEPRPPRGTGGILREWLESLEEQAAAAGRDGEADAVEAQPEPPAEPPRPGIVPPSRPLPVRYGPSWASLWGTRLAAVVGILWGISHYARGIELGGRGLLATAVALLFLVLTLRGWMKRRDEVQALAVTFEPAGISVLSVFVTRRLAWGDLVGLAPVGTGRGAGWAIHAVQDGRKLTVRLPRDKRWAQALVETLQGKSRDLDPRFARPAPARAPGPPPAAPPAPPR